MAEAVFTISANIEPTLDQRQLERQGQEIARQLSGTFKKEIQPIDLKVAAGNVFQKVIDTARRSLQNFGDTARNALTKVRDGFDTVVTKGRAGFLKLADTFKLTQRSLVGFGGNIREIIERTNLFETALNKLRQTGDSFQELPTQFQNVRAQIEAGVSPLQQAAEGGNQFAQALVPMTVISAGLARQLDGVVGGLETVARALAQTSAAANTGVGDLSLLEAEAEKNAEAFLRIAPSAGAFTDKLEELFKEAQIAGGSTDELIRKLNEFKTTAVSGGASLEQFGGITGRIGVLLNKLGLGFKDVDAEAQKLARFELQELNRQLVAMGGGDTLSRIERLQVRFLNARDAVTKFKDGVEGVRTSLTPVTNAISDFANQAVASVDSVSTKVGDSLLNAFKLPDLNTFFKSFQQSMNEGANSLGQFFGKNLTGALKNGLSGVGGQLREVGSEIVNGLTKGIENQTTLLGKVRQIGRNIIEGIQNILGISSPSTVMIAIGKFIVQGLAKGIELGAKAVLAPMKAIADGLISVVKGAASLAKQGFESLVNVGKAAGLALAGLGATAVVTGSQFNILQQVVNATLPTILGSAEASKKLLAEVNALNDSSPFARSAFIELTRVLAGFGVEAEKIGKKGGVIDAIQQAVAATGGGEQDLLELGQAFAKIASQGKLSGDIIQSFTVRGIDVLGILGQQFGKTTAEVQEMISNGLVPANKAIDALTKGIVTKFDGATDAVSKNFPGALDRVKAKLRDMGAALTKAFINPEGGGALVDLFNAIAVALTAVTKIIIPIFLPAIQAVANIITNLSTKLQEFVKPLLDANKGFTQLGFAAGSVTAQIKPFVDQLGAFIPILAGIVGFFPAFLSFIPVVGPLLGSIGGPGGAVLAVFVALVARSKELQDALKGLVTGFQSAFSAFSSPELGGVSGIFDKVTESIKAVEQSLAGGLASFIQPLGAAFGQLAAQVGPVVLDVLPKFAELLQTLGEVLGPLVAKVITTLSPVIAFLIAKVGELLPSISGALSGLKNGLDPIIEALGRLLVSIQPVVDLLKGVLIVAFQTLAVILPPVGDAIAFIIDLFTNFFNVVGPGIQVLADAFTSFGDNILGIADKFEGFINGAIKGINVLIRAFNKLPAFLRPGSKIKELDEVNFKFSVDERAAERAKKQVEAIGFAVKTQVPTAKQLETAYKDAFGAASKAAEEANKKVSSLTDSLTQSLQQVGQKIEPLFNAKTAVNAANDALKTARANAATAAGEIGKLEQERAKALRDALTPVQEMAAAERELTRTRNGLAKIQRDILDTEKELADLRNAELIGEKRAALDRAIERAKISLNKATRDQIALDKEANKVAIPSVNLAGLSLDQIRAKLANVRASLQAQKSAQALTEQTGKTQQEIDDEHKSAALDVADAEQNLKDATRARSQFELDNSNAIRDNEEKLQELRFSKEEQMLKEQEDLNKIKDLRAGETQQQAIIKDFEEKIKKAKEDNAKAQQAVTKAITDSKLAEAELAKQSAIVRNDTLGIAAAQQNIWNLKKTGLTFDKLTEEALKSQLSSVQAIINELKNAKIESEAAEKRRLEAEAALKKFNIDQAIKGVNEELDRATNFERFNGGFELAQNRDALLSGMTKLAAFLREAGNAGAIQTKSGDVAAAQRIIAQPAFLEALAKAVLENPNGDLRAVLRALLDKAGLRIPGFATGYAPGELVHQGMNDGKGLVRMFEYGKEAVLPLTRAMDMKRVVQNPSVLPAILQALPKISLAAKNGDPNAIQTLNNLSSMSTTTGSSASQFQSRQAKKQDNEAMAASIGSAVKVAVKEALAETDGLGGADVDINIAPSSNHEVAIANEVRRQIKKYFEGRR